MKKGIYDSKIAYYILLTILLASAIFGLITLKKFIGYAGFEVPAEAGTITTIIVDDRTQSSHWAGLFGLVFTESGFGEEQSVTLDAGDISANTFVFDCVDPNNGYQEFYASTNDSIDFDNIRAGATDMIDVDFLNLSNTTIDRANNTFTANVSILVGNTNISGVPGVYTYVNDAPDSSNAFFTGILNESGRLVMVARLYSSSTTSFKGTNVRYQMLLPVPNSSTKYYFFADPNDECPAGFGTGQVGDAIITGYVLEWNSTTPLPNATVSAGGNTSLTDSNGLFNLTVPGGRTYNLIGIKEGYNTNITSVNTIIGDTTEQNLTMARFFGFIGPNGTISGYVKDNSSGAIIENATISIAGLVAISNATGNYSFDVEGGTYVIAAVKNGYENFVGNFTISAYQNMSFLINMSSVAAAAAEAGTILNNGTIQGSVRDNSTNTTLANVTVTVAGESNVTNSAGFYNITVLQGTTNLVATKSNYNAFYAEVNIGENNITEFNFSMDPVIIGEGVGNGTIEGFVKTSSGVALSDSTVSAAGKSNISNSTGK